jgi:hypothetical protein
LLVRWHLETVPPLQRIRTALRTGGGRFSYEGQGVQGGDGAVEGPADVGGDELEADGAEEDPGLTVTIIALAKWSEELAKVVREHRRLFSSWKLPPCGELVPPCDVEMALGERSRCGRHADALVGEHCDPGWDLDAVLLEEGRRPSHRVVRLERGVGRSGHPVNGERREDPLERKSTDRLTSTIAPRPVLLEEPRSEADRRVRQGISERPPLQRIRTALRTSGGRFFYEGEGVEGS